MLVSIACVTLLLPLPFRGCSGCCVSRRQQRPPNNGNHQLSGPCELPELADDLLQAERREAVEMHVENCWRCCCLLQQMAQLQSAELATQTSSLHFSPSQFARTLPLVSSQAGRPAWIASTVLPAGTVYRVVWRGIAQEQVTKREEQARPAGPLPDTAVSVFRLLARNLAKTAQGAAVSAVAPFDAAAARQYQEASAEHRQVPVEYTNLIGMRFRLIPSGRFLMGSTDAQVTVAKPFLYMELDSARKGRADTEMPQHLGTLTRPFYLGITEVT